MSSSAKNSAKSPTPQVSKTSKGSPSTKSSKTTKGLRTSKESGVSKKSNPSLQGKPSKETKVSQKSRTKSQQLAFGSLKSLKKSENKDDTKNKEEANGDVKVEVHKSNEAAGKMKEDLDEEEGEDMDENLKDTEETVEETVEDEVGTEEITEESGEKEVDEEEKEEEEEEEEEDIEGEEEEGTEGEEEEEEEEVEEEIEIKEKVPVIYFEMPVLKTCTKDFKFMQFVPKVPSFSTYHLYEQITYKAVLKIGAHTDPKDVMVEVLTNQKDPEFPDGSVHSVRLHLRGPVQEKGLYVYGAHSLMICPFSTFTFNYRAKHTSDEEWTNPPMQPGVKGTARVNDSDPVFMHPSLKDQPNFVHIVDCVFIGDAVALEQVPLLPFSDVLCVDASLPSPPWVAKMEAQKKKKMSIALSTFWTGQNATNNASNGEELEKLEGANSKGNGASKRSEGGVSLGADLSVNSEKDGSGSDASFGPDDVGEDGKRSESPLKQMLSEGLLKQRSNDLAKSKTMETEDDSTELTDKVESEEAMKFVYFHRIPFPTQSEKPMEPSMLMEAVNWVRAKTLLNKPTLIVSTHAFRRAPNVALALLYRQKIRPTVKQCHQLIACKRPIFLAPDLYSFLNKEFSTAVSDPDLRNELKLKSKLFSKLFTKKEQSTSKRDFKY